ncbi:hypothetical protein [Magnetovibrio blakemorei]|nr:hypothetical protein [Magnetovibrio blakemorei]
MKKTNQSIPTAPSSSAPDAPDSSDSPAKGGFKNLPPINLGHGPRAILSNVKTAPGRRLTPDEIVASEQKQHDYFNTQS